MRKGLTLWAVSGWLWLVGLTSLGLLGYGVERHNFESAGLAFGAGLLVLAWFVRGARDEPIDSLENPRSALVHSLPALVGVVSFGWSIVLGPLSDDFVLRLWAVTGTWVPDEWPYVRPLPLAVWQSVFAVGGGWTALHALNVLIHSTNGALVAGIGAKWLGLRSGVVAGMLFAAFPASVEAVAWNAGIFDLLAACCALLALTLWLSAARSRASTVALLVICTAGMLSKESAVAIPGLLLLAVAMSRYPLRAARERAVPLLLAVALAVGFVAIRAILSPSVANHVQNLPSDRRQLKDLLVRPFTGVSVPMRTETGLGGDAYVIGLVILVLVGLVLFRLIRSAEAADGSRRRLASAVCVSMGWILLTSVPLLLQFYVSPSLEGSRYLYLPAAGFALAMSASISGSGFRRLDLVASIALLGLLGLYGWRLNAERQVWLEAAAIRDALLANAMTVAREVPCGTLTVQDAPGDLRGAFVFRVGLPEALAGVALTPSGEACVFRWTGSALVPVPGR